MIKLRFNQNLLKNIMIEYKHLELLKKLVKNIKNVN